MPEGRKPPKVIDGGKGRALFGWDVLTRRLELVRHIGIQALALEAGLGPNLPMHCGRKADQKVSGERRFAVFPARGTETSGQVRVMPSCTTMVDARRGQTADG